MYMKQNSVIVVGIVGLVLGFGLGYMVAPKTAPSATTVVDHSSMTMGDTMSSMTASLDGKTGAALEEAFLVGMIEHHEGAIAMAKVLKEGTTRPELLKMADDIITVQSSEIEMMHGWLRLWFGK